MDEYLDFLKLVLPSILVDHFDLLKSKKKGERLSLFFEEKAQFPDEHKSRELISKGFHKEVIVQDFPLRGKYVFLHIKRRRWTDRKTNEIVERNWDEIAKGTRMTKEFASFLKEIGQY